MSLRDLSMSTEVILLISILSTLTGSLQDICAALVSLHLLDSLPLKETLHSFLLQRSKKLQAILTWNPHVKTSDESEVLPSSHSEEIGTIPVREVTQVMKDALNTIMQTVCMSRAIFNAQADVPSLLLQILESIQSESNSRHPSDLPANLRVSTPTILGLLTSSSTFQLLSSDVRAYRPYVDIDTCSASLTQSVFHQKLQQWFSASCETWQASSSKWFSGLSGVKEIWTLRTSVKRLITTSHLSEGEKAYLSSNMDTVCHDQIVSIWSKKLSQAEEEFKFRLRSQVSEHADVNQSGLFLFLQTDLLLIGM